MADVSGKDEPGQFPAPADESRPDRSDVPPEEIIAQLVKSGKLNRIIQITERFQSFEGPFPPPEILDQYDRRIDNFSERWMRLLETAHQDNLANHAAERFTRKAGMFFAGGAVLVVCGLSYGIASMGGLTQAASLAGATLVGLAGTFMADRYQKAAEARAEHRRRALPLPRDDEPPEDESDGSNPEMRAEDGNPS